VSVSRIGVRVAALALLAVGVTGGLYLNTDRARLPRSAAAGQEVAANAAENAVLKEDLAERATLTAEQRAKQVAAAAKAAAEAKAAADRAKAAENEASRRNSNRTPDYGPIPASCSVYSGSRAIGCAELLKGGWALSQMPCLDKLWNRESGWNYKSYNSSSGAYGIPQALPGSKMAAFGDDWKTNPATQIKWGLDYIKNRYGSPCNAWQHSEDVGWY
jgi:hypothetical protein